MQVTYLKYINLKKLIRINKKIATNSTNLTDYKRLKFYKLFNERVNLDYKAEKILDAKAEKMNLFDKLDGIDFVSKAEALIEDDTFIIGYYTNFIKGTLLYDLHDLDFKKLFLLLLKVSKHLEILHKQKGTPVIGDFHFQNILIGEKGNDYFTDYDSYGINGIKADNISNTLYDYCEYMNYKIYKNQEYDRLQFMLALFDLIFQENILSIGYQKFKEYMEKYPALEKLEEIYFDLNSSYHSLPDIDYFHELIKEEDILKM